MQLQIKVFSGISSMEENKRLFERVVETNDSLSVPFESLVQDLKFLFGSACIIQLNVQ